MTDSLPIILPAGSLRISFLHYEDRLAHTIGVAQGDRLMPLLASEEGPLDSPWPASPPFQEVHVESRDGQEVALLVGKYGPNHWSASITAASDTLECDLACRFHEEPPISPAALGSAYRSMVLPVAMSPSAVELTTADATVCVEYLGEPEMDQHIELDESGFRIHGGHGGDSLPRTVRWRYRIGVA